MASGGNDVGNIDTDPPVEAYILYGGVVGGPDKRGRYFDIRSDWPQTEVLQPNFFGSSDAHKLF
jgi:endoglucanase